MSKILKLNNRKKIVLQHLEIEKATLSSENKFTQERVACYNKITY